MSLTKLASTSTSRSLNLKNAPLAMLPSVSTLQEEATSTLVATLIFSASTSASVANIASEKLNTLVRSAQTLDVRERNRESGKASHPWESEPQGHEVHSIRSYQTHSEKDARPHTHTHHDLRSQTPVNQDPRSLVPQNQPRSRDQPQKHSIDQRQHVRNDSGATGGGHSSADYAEPQQSHGRRHDYDVQSMETSVVPRALPKNPIPSPIVTVRSEFPTLNRSRQQQSLTCLVTIEVVDGKWRPDPEDIRTPPPMFSPDHTDSSSQPRSPDRSPRIDIPRERPEVLTKVSEDLRTRVDNWHGLDFSRCAMTTYATLGWSI